MKATIEYNLPEDQFEYDNAVKSMKMWSALTEIEHELRRQLKCEDLKENQYEIIELLRSYFYEVLHDNEINLE
jgi:hypothetical protein